MNYVLGVVTPLALKLDGISSICGSFGLGVDIPAQIFQYKVIK